VGASEQGRGVMHGGGEVCVVAKGDGCVDRIGVHVFDLRAAGM